MLLASFPSGPLAANCYVVARESGTDCVVIDPGMGASDTVAKIVTEHTLRPVAVLLTHGHVDHSADAAAVADRYEAACVIGPGDRHQLSDPLSALPASMHPLLGDLVPRDPAEPTTVAALDPEPEVHELAGLEFRVLPAPGHTPGSQFYALRLPTDDSTANDEPEQIVFTGDVVFAGSVGRTDLPGGDQGQMDRTLAEVVLGLPDETVLLPGHGPQTTVGRERSQNPFLR